MSVDTSAVTLNKFPHSKGATWVVVRTVCSQAVDKPVQCSKTVIAVREIFSELLNCCSYCICGLIGTESYNVHRVVSWRVGDVLTSSS